MGIIYSEHVLQRFCERINPNLMSITDYHSRLRYAKKAIKAILLDARYVSDDQRGILLHSPTYKCNLIIKEKKLITIYPIKSKK